jgi:uncharacterized protein YciW
MSNVNELRAAALALGHQEPISIEPDFTIWLGADDDRQYLTAQQLQQVHDKVDELAADREAARQSALAKLAALGLTVDEIAALVG